MSTAIKERNNNVDVIRVVAAVLVMVSHAYNFAENTNRDIIVKLSCGTYSLGGVCVCVFFMFSGYFIHQSLLHDDSGTEYFKKRIKRLFPAFVLVTALIAFVMGPCITTFSLREYFTHPATYRYMLNCIFITQHSLPGVFENNIYGTVVNGPIWTIKVEFACYIIAYMLHRVKADTKKRSLCVAVLFGAVTFWMGQYTTQYHLFNSFMLPVSVFLTGMALSSNREKIQYNLLVVIAVLVGMAVFMRAGFPLAALMAGMPYVVMYLAFGIKQCPFKIYECSYEMYLWGGALQQLVTSLFGGSMSPYLNMAIAIPAAYVMAVVTKKVIKKAECLHFM